jgi:type I restriction enzyme S subunit
MENWKTVKLSDVCEIVMGLSPKGESYNQEGNGIPLLNGAADYKKNCFKPKQYTSAPTRIAPKGSIVACIRATIGNLGIVDKEYCIGRGVAAFSVDELKLNRKYLFHYLNNVFHQFKIKAAGSTIKGIKKEHLTDFLIPLPPIEEQLRISEILEMADALRIKNQEQVEHYVELVRSVFLEMFGDPVINPMEWQVKKCEDVLHAIIGGWSVSGEDKQPTKDEYAVFKISSVTTGMFRPTKVKVVPKENIIKQLVFPKKGDLLFSRANTRELVGAVALVDRDYDNIFLPDKLWKLVIDKEVINNYFLKEVFQNPSFRYELTKKATGTSGSMLNISKAKLKEMNIPCPPLAKQHEFAQIVENIETQKSKIEIILQESEDLFGTLVQKAFKGELK